MHQMLVLEEATRQRLANEFFGEYPHEVDAIIAGVAEGSKPAGFANYIDDPDIAWYDRTNIGIVLPELASEELAKKLGSDAVLWAAANARTIELMEQHTLAVATARNLDRRIIRQVIRDTSSSTTIQQACALKIRLDLAEYMVHAPDQVDLEQLIGANYKEGVQMPADRAMKYGLVAVWPNNGFGNGFVKREWPGSENITYKTPYLDAPYGLMLTYDQAPVAYASYHMKTPADVTVAQIQGVTGEMTNADIRYRPHGISCIEWQRLFINIGEKAARHIGAPTLQVAPTEAVYNVPGNLAKHYQRPALSYGLVPESDASWQLPLA